MKKITFILLAFLSFQYGVAQTLKENKVGKIFFLSTPDYMTKLYDLSDNASFSAGSYEKEAYTLVIQEEKAKLKANEIDATTKNTYFNNAVESLKSNITVTKEGTAKDIKVGAFEAKQVELYATLEQEEGDPVKIVYHMTIIETPEYIYKIMSWSNEADFTKYRPDFIKIASSFRE